jgi:membrane-bound lytic murein transglycosylase B
VRASRILLVLGVAVIVVGLVAVAVIPFVRAALPQGRTDAEREAEQPAATWSAPAPAPQLADADAASIADIVSPGWIAATSAATGIPERALAAYTGVAARKAQHDPACGLTWATLAGIGAAESDHGRFAGSSLDAGGVATPPIYGIPLTGETTNRIPDTDGGEFDGDAEWDRAIGPMQLLPSTWRDWRSDGDLDGDPNPQDIDDAVFAASSYLCARDPDMSTEAGWRAAIVSYNPADHYVGRVARLAEEYRTAAERVAGEAAGAGVGAGSAAP